MRDNRLFDDFDFRSIYPDEREQAAAIEQICFLPHEACPEADIFERVEKVPESFLTAVDQQSGRLAGFISGLRTMETAFRDQFFSDADLHDPEGVNLMLIGLAVLPEYRGRGLAGELMERFVSGAGARQKACGWAILTCHEELVPFYEKMGFTDLGLSASAWGNEAWHEMRRSIGPDEAQNRR